MDKSMDETLDSLLTTINKDLEPEKLKTLTHNFLKEYLAESLFEKEAFDPSNGGKLGQAILQAQTKGQRFVLAGLEDLDEDLDELKKRANHQIDDLNKRLEIFSNPWYDTKGFLFDLNYCKNIVLLQFV